MSDLLAWHPHPSVWILLGGATMAYLMALRYWGPSHVSVGDPPATRTQMLCFICGIAVMWIGAEWPIHEIAERYLFSVHMVQHLLFSLVAAPLLLLGTPDWLARKLLRPRPVFAVMRRLTRPLMAMAIFNAFLVFSHWPAFVDFVVSSEIAHFGAHVLLVATSLLMWWPVISPLPELGRLSQPVQMLYLFGQTIVPTVPASFLTFAESAFYRVYADAPRLFAGIDAVTDQRIAGLVMKLGGGFLLWAIIAVLFFRWSSKEETGAPDAIDWQDLERRVNQPEPHNS